MTVHQVERPQLVNTTIFFSEENLNHFY